MARVIVVGAAAMDFVFYVDEFPCAAEKYRARDAAIVGGGNAANAAVAISRLGSQSLLATRLGADRVGQMICDELSGEGVDLSLTDRNGERSSYSSILIDGHGERQIVNYRGEGLVVTPKRLESAPAADAILADTRWAEGALAAMTLARARGVPGILDVEAPADPSAFCPASHLAFSEQGLAHFHPDLTPERAVERMASDHGGWVCVTMGARGVAWCDSGGSGHVPAFRVDVVDTLGAGDVWHGAFALRLGEGASEIEAVGFANAAAALKCARPGGRTGTPTRSEAETLMREARTCN